VVDAFKDRLWSRGSSKADLSAASVIAATTPQAVAMASVPSVVNVADYHQRVWTPWGQDGRVSAKTEVTSAPVMAAAAPQAAPQAVPQAAAAAPAPSKANVVDASQERVWTAWGQEAGASTNSDIIVSSASKAPKSWAALANMAAKSSKSNWPAVAKSVAGVALGIFTLPVLGLLVAELLC